MSETTGTSFDRKLFSRLLKYTRPYKKTFMAVAVAALLLSLFSTVRPVLLKYTVDDYILTKDADGVLLFVVLMTAVLILEELEHALARKAHIYGELLGYGTSADAYHISAPAENGAGAVQSMRLALKDAGLTPADIDYINAHGTSTPLNDKSETAAIKTVFGDHAYRLPISSTKSVHGHLMGAAGALEALIALKAMEHNLIPPTAN